MSCHRLHSTDVYVASAIWSMRKSSLDILSDNAHCCIGGWLNGLTGLCRTVRPARRQWQRFVDSIQTASFLVSWLADHVTARCNRGQRQQLGCPQPLWQCNERRIPSRVTQSTIYFSSFSNKAFDLLVSHWSQISHQAKVAGVWKARPVVTQWQGPSCSPDWP